jgi:hypothetical protein
MTKLRRAPEYQSLYPEHQKFAFQTTPIFDQSSFRSRDCFENWEGVGYSDFQLQQGNRQFHLGSSRSVHFDGFYLKGVGMTSIAPARPTDFYHGTGHLLPSSAAREYLISEWVKGLGLSDSIVPCEGILAAKLDDFLIDSVKEIYAVTMDEKLGQIPLCDLHLKSISIKPSNFLRYSNLGWYMHTQIDEFISSIEQIITDWWASLHGNQKPDDSTDISDIFKQIEAKTVERALRFFEFQKSGITWMTMNNNFTADLRFLDLEIPVVSGPNRIFNTSIVNETEIFGARVELFQLVRQIRMWILDLLGWCQARILRFEYTQSDFHRNQTQFLKQIVDELQTTFLKNSQIFKDDFWFSTVFEHYKTIYDSGDHAKLEKVLRVELYLKLIGGAVVTEEPFESEPMSYDIELGRNGFFRFPSWSKKDYGSIGSIEHAFFGELIRRVEATDTVEGYLGELKHATAQIHKFFQKK